MLSFRKKSHVNNMNILISAYINANMRIRWISLKNKIIKKNLSTIRQICMFLKIETGLK